MATADQDVRRIRVRSAFTDGGFEFVNANANVKADRFQKGTDCFLYFYWQQGKELNLSINPGIDYLALIKLEGVSVPKRLRKSAGLRPGTAVKDFPKTFEGIVPKDPQSRVGRMLEIQESALASFLRAFVSLVELTARHSDAKSVSSGVALALQSLFNDVPNLSADIVSVDVSESTAQGYESDPVLRRAIEQYAVKLAHDHYLSDGYQVKELGKPFDLLCERQQEVIHVEVKGSRSQLNSVIVTVNEITDARLSAWRSDLFIVEGIFIDAVDTAKPKAHGGNARVLWVFRSIVTGHSGLS